MQYLEEVELKLKPTKCAFVQTKIDYLKHMLLPKRVQQRSNQAEANLKLLHLFMQMNILSYTYVLGNSFIEAIILLTECL